MKTLLTYTLAAAALALSSSPAFAQPEPVGQQLIINYADLDLSTERGVQLLDRRLRAAANVLCGPTSDSDLRGKNEAQACRVDTLGIARAQRDAAIAGRGPSRQIQVAARR